MACSKEEAQLEILTYESFQKNLTSDMNYDAIVRVFGEPDADVGSGIHVYVYKLDDSTEVWIGYADSVLYARHLGQNQQALHVLI